jgi:hypothetical protein
MDNKELRIDLLRKIYGCDKDKLLDEVKKKYNFVKQRESIMQEELDKRLYIKLYYFHSSLSIHLSTILFIKYLYKYFLSGSYSSSL